MKRPLRALLVEDSEDDALLLLRELRRAGFDLAWQRVWTAEDMEHALKDEAWQIIICDYSMPGFNALDALRIVRQSGQDLPFIIVSGAIGEDVAVAAMRAGAHDYLMKSNLARLAPAIDRELQEAEDRRQRRKAEEALRLAQKTESLGLMAGGLAHDFNNLIIALLAQTSLALAKLPPESPAREHLAKTIKAGERATDLTRQMLQYAGHGKTTREPVALSEQARENLGLLAAAVPKNVQLSASLAEGLPAVHGDPSQIQQVIMNLVLNAADAMDGRGGQVTVRTWSHTLSTADARRSFIEKAPEGGEYVVLTVEDDGMGMDGETLARIFDPFFTTKKKGRGLGLAAVLGIVRGHNGGIEVVSKVGQGTTFNVFFPADISYVAAGRQPQASGQTGAASLDGSVLVIDDEESVREAVTDILEFSGIDVLVADNGADGIAMVKACGMQVRLVLLDLTMPGMSGEETLRGLREVRSDLRIVVSTGRDRSEAMDQLDPGWKVEFLQKPYGINDLLELVMSEPAQV